MTKEKTPNKGLFNNFNMSKTATPTIMKEVKYRKQKMKLLEDKREIMRKGAKINTNQKDVMYQLIPTKS